MLPARGFQIWQHLRRLGGCAPRLTRARSACGRVELAGRGAGAQAVRRRGRSVCRRPAPRHRHRRSDGSRGAGSGHGGCLLRGHGPARGTLPDDPHRRRVLDHPGPPGIDRLAGRNGGRRKRGRGDDRPERRARGHRAVRPPRHSADRRSELVPRPALAAPGPPGAAAASSCTWPGRRAGRPTGDPRAHAGGCSAQAAACASVARACSSLAPHTLAPAGLVIRPGQARARPSGAQGGGHASSTRSGSRRAHDSRPAGGRSEFDERARNTSPSRAPGSP